MGVAIATAAFAQTPDCFAVMPDGERIELDVCAPEPASAPAENLPPPPDPLPTAEEPPALETADPPAPEPTVRRVPRQLPVNPAAPSSRCGTLSSQQWKLLYRRSIEPAALSIAEVNRILGFAGVRQQSDTPQTEAYWLWCDRANANVRIEARFNAEGDLVQLRSFGL